MKPTFFTTPAAFRKWLERHAHKTTELLVGFHKSDSGKASITWAESVDEALCFGWIDGVRKRVDDASYTIRFTPRKPSSTWSTVNCRKVEELSKAGRMTPAGQAAFAKRSESKTGIYSHEKRPEALVEPYAGMLAKKRKATQFLASQAAWYQRTCIWWVISAKKEETRLKRLQTLIELSQEGKCVPQFVRRPAK